MSQLLLLPDPRPLDQRLGRKFFLKAPRRPGVYVMRDAADKILYIGKAKDLKQRLSHYRNANPDRMPRRHLRMVREVARIEFEFCHTESDALQREKKLIRTHKPKFNRAGVWEGKPRFLVWQFAENKFRIGVSEIPGATWRRFGPLGANAVFLQKSLSRLLWLAAHPQKLLSELPMMWHQRAATLEIPFSDLLLANDLSHRLDGYFWESPEFFLSWLMSLLAHRSSAFEQQFITQDLEVLQSLKASPEKSQFSLL